MNLMDFASKYKSHLALLVVILATLIGAYTLFGTPVLAILIVCVFAMTGLALFLKKKGRVHWLGLLIFGISFLLLLTATSWLSLFL